MLFQASITMPNKFGYTDPRIIGDRIISENKIKFQQTFVCEKSKKDYHKELCALKINSKRRTSIADRVMWTCIRRVENEISVGRHLRTALFFYRSALLEAHIEEPRRFSEGF